jgi:hypothetical protein
MKQTEALGRGEISIVYISLLLLLRNKKRDQHVVPELNTNAAAQFA